MYPFVSVKKKNKESVTFCSLVGCFVIFSLCWTGVIFWVLVSTLVPVYTVTFMCKCS